MNFITALFSSNYEDFRKAGIRWIRLSARRVICAVKSFRSEITRKIMGITINVNRVELIKPPMTVIARGDHKSPDSPSPRDIGTKPRIVDVVVMTMGRRRSSPARINSSY